MTPVPVHGPFHTPQDLTAAAQPLDAALRAVEADGALSEAGRRARARIRFQYLLDALAQTGVGLGNGDTAVARSLAAAPVETLVVIADWLARANAAGNVELLAKAAEYLPPCKPGPGGRCEHGVWAECAQTDTAWELRGIDPAAARAHAVSGGHRRAPSE